MVEEGHFCLPKDGNVEFKEGSRHMEDWFLLWMKYGIDPPHSRLGEPTTIIPSSVGRLSLVALCVLCVCVCVCVCAA